MLEEIFQQFFAIFNMLLIFCQKHQIPLELPKLVIVGGQNKGKSSILENTAGLQFNHITDGLGTKRPLQLQMINDPNCDTPVWKLMSHTDSVNGEILSDEDLRKVIKRLNSKGFSKDPIILQLRYYKCSNITIEDLPGFRVNDMNSSDKEFIEELVVERTKDKNTIILCVESATEEISNSISLNFIKKRIDPNFERTILVLNKLDLIIPTMVEQGMNEKQVNERFDRISKENAPKNYFFTVMPSNINLRKVSGVEYELARNAIESSTRDSLIELRMSRK